MASSQKKTAYILGGIIVSLLLMIVLILGFTITKQDQVAVDKLNAYKAEQVKYDQAYTKISGILDEYKQYSKRLESGNSIDAKGLVDIADEINDKIVKPTDSLSSDKIPPYLSSVASSLANSSSYTGVFGVKRMVTDGMTLVRSAKESAGISEASSLVLHDDRLMFFDLKVTSEARIQLRDAIKGMLNISLPEKPKDSSKLSELEANAKPKPLVTYLVKKMTGN